MSDNPIPPVNSNDNDPPKIKLKAAEKKSDTARIDLASAKPPPSIVDKSLLPWDADDYFKRSTIRIDVPPSSATKSDTTRIHVSPTTPSDAAKRQTSKIDLSSAASSSDHVFKSKTIPVGVPVSPPASAANRPKTIQMKRPSAAPGESIIVSPETTATATEQARKSETARIDLSAEELDRPATRPKTIRIKRPDGTSGRKPLTISRPEDSAAPSTTLEPIGELGDDSDEPSTWVSLVAIAALLVVCALVYALLGQYWPPLCHCPDAFFNRVI